MNREVFQILGELTKDAPNRNPDQMRKLADQLCAEGSNEIKDLYGEYLKDHPELEESSAEVQQPESLQISDHDRNLLKNLLHPK